MENYASLIVDIKKSKSYDVEERNDLQHYMDACIRSLNKLFAKQLQFEVTFSGGDEVQGLFKNAVSAFAYYRILELLVFPIKMRAGIGVGEWTVRIDNGMSTQQDGTAYHRARLAIKTVHAGELKNVWICSEKEDGLANHLINAALPLKYQQVTMQNVVQTLIELLYPFVPSDLDGEDSIKELIRKLLSYKLTGKEFDVSQIPDPYPIYIDGVIGEDGFQVTKMQMAKAVAEILLCSRQNADAIMRRGHLEKIRELDYVSLQYISEYYGGL